MKINILPLQHIGNLNVSTLIVRLPDSIKTLTRFPVHLHGSSSGGMDRDLTGARPPLSDRRRGSKIINNNYCVGCVGGKTLCSRTCINSEISRLLQQTVSCPKTQQQVETYTRPRHPEQFFKDRVIQYRDTRDNKDLPARRGAGYLHRFHRHILSYIDTQSVQEVHAF